MTPHATALAMPDHRGERRPTKKKGAAPRALARAMMTVRKNTAPMLTLLLLAIAGTVSSWLMMIRSRADNSCGELGIR